MCVYDHLSLHVAVPLSMPVLSKEELKAAKAGGAEPTPSPSTDPSDYSSGEDLAEDIFLRDC